MLFRPQLFALDQVVVPVQLFAKVADRTHQFALSRISRRWHVDWLIQKIHEGSGLGLLYVGECLFETILAAQANIDQALVDFKLVLEESDLQLFSAQAAAQSLNCRSCTAVRLVGRVFISYYAFHLAHQELSLVEKRGRIQVREILQRRAAVLFREASVAQAQCNSRQ